MADNGNTTVMPEPANGYSAFREFLRRFSKEYLALISLGFVLLLFLTAVYAPLIVNGYPLLIIGEDGSWTSPALHDFFAPDVQEVFVEKVFNFLLPAIPVALIVLLAGRFLKKTLRFMILAVLLTALAVPFFCVQQRNDTVNYRELQQTHPEKKMIFAPVPYSPFATSAQIHLKPCKAHIFGTDQLGRDVFARMVYGSRVSLAVGFFAAGISLLLGTAVGLVSGYLGGKIDLTIQRLVEIVICFPTFLLLLILMTIMLDRGSRQSILLVILVLGCTGWPGLARLVRGEVLKQRQMQYIQACECTGLPAWRTIFIHLLPNVCGPVFVAFSFDIAGSILAENSLSFLGFGVQIPTASWGELLRQALEEPLLYWNLMLWPGLAVFLCVCSFTFIADGVRKSIDLKNN